MGALGLVVLLLFVGIVWYLSRKTEIKYDPVEQQTYICVPKWYGTKPCFLAEEVSRDEFWVSYRYFDGHEWKQLLVGPDADDGGGSGTPRYADP